MGGKSAPDAPDYRGAAEEQAEASRVNLAQQTWANRPTLTTPWGQMTWNTNRAIDPATGDPITRWSGDLSLTPGQQQALDYQQQLQTSRSGLAAGLYDRLAGEYADPVDWSQYQELGGVPTPGEFDPSQRYYQDAEDAIYGQWERRQEPRLENQMNALDTQLRNQGLTPGTEAYDYQMQQLRQAQDDARLGAQYQATMGAGQEAARMLGMDTSAQGQTYQQGMMSSNYQNQLRQQQIAEDMMRRGYTLNEVNAILTGQQVSQPQMPGFNAAGVAPAPDYTGAAAQQGQWDIGQYGADQARLGGMMSGLGSMLTGAGMLGWQPFGS